MNLRSLSLIIVAAFTVALFTAKTAEAGIRIYRDDNGVPHVYADTNTELFRGLGYMIGKDRLFQLEMRKRQALGRRAEVLGRTDQPRWTNKFVEKDTFSRQWLDLDALQSQVDQLEDNDRALLEAYVAGVNLAIDEALENNGAGLPDAFRVHGFTPEKWTLMDVVGMTVDALASYADFSLQDANLALYKFLAKKYPESCDDVFEQFVWKHDPYAVTTTGDQLPPNATVESPVEKGCAAAGGTMPNNLAALGETSVFAAAGDRAIEPRRASMAWAVGKERAKEANTIFVSGPQVGWHRPAYYYTIGLHGGDYDFIGMTAEGIPVFPIGFNRHYAWGITAGLGLQADLVMLTLSEDGKGYIHDGEVVPFDIRQEVINIKNEEPENITVRWSRYGPVIEYDDEAGTAVAKLSHWRGQELTSAFAWFDSARSMSFPDWQEHVEKIGYNYNLFYGDRHGRVGFAFTGRFAIRHQDVDKRLPFKGDGSLDPEGYTSPEDTIVYSTEDVIYNFNNRPTRHQPNSGLMWEQWSRGYQVEILKEAIDDWPEKVDWNQVWDLNRVISYADVNYHPFKDIFAKAVAGLDEDDPRYAAAQAVVAWDGMRIDENADGFFDSAGLTIFDVWIDKLVRATLGPTLDGAREAGAGGAANYFLGYVHQRLPARLEEHPSGGTLATMRAFLAADGAPGIHNFHDFFDGAGARAAALAALTDAVEELEGSFETKETDQWKTPTTPQTYFPSNTDRTPMSVATTRTNHGVYANRGAVNLVVEYGEDGKITRSGFANPLGGPEDKTADDLSDYHLELYANQELAPIRLETEEDMKDSSADLIREFP